MKLTPEQIQEICAELHERLQFYNGAGHEANGDVVPEIAEQLTAAFIDEPSMEEIRAEQRAEETGIANAVP